MATRSLDIPGTGPRIAGSVAYGAQGMVFAALVTRIPTIQLRFTLTDTTLAMLLAIVPIFAGVGSIAAGAAISRIGDASVLRILGPVVPVALVCVGLSTSMPLLIASLLLIGFGLGGVDAAMNAHGVAVETRSGRSLMGSFFAVFSLAGFIGAALAAWAAGTSLPLAAFFGILAVVVISCQLIAGPHLLRGRVEIDGTIDDVSPAHPNTAHITVPWRPILIIGLALMLGYIADSAASNWSAVYLTKGLKSSESVAALAFAAYALSMLVSRTLVDRGVMARGPVLLVRVGASVAVAAALLIAIAPTPVWGLVAFGLLGIGLAPIMPLALTAAAQHDRLGTGIAVSRVNVFNYAGFVLGAPLIGVVADLTSLRWAFALLIPVLLTVVVLAPAFRVRSEGDGVPSQRIV